MKQEEQKYASTTPRKLDVRIEVTQMNTTSTAVFISSLINVRKPTNSYAKMN